MENLERMKLEVELMRVKAAKAELSYKIAERQEEIRKLAEHVSVQDNKIKELEEKLTE